MKYLEAAAQSGPSPKAAVVTPVKAAKVAVVAIKRGDVSFFLCFMLRLDQIDCECIKAGMDAGARAHIIQCRAALDGFRQAAQKRLESLGGEFPPQPRQSEPKKTQTAVRPAA